MKRYDPLSNLDTDDEIICDICGGVIPLGSEYVTVAAEDETGEIVGHLVAHSACAEALSEAELGAILGATLTETDEDDDDPTARLDAVLPLEHCCLCGDRIGESDYINFVEPMHPGDPHSPLVATTFHTACYRTDPDGVQRALDEEIQKQRTRRDESS